MIEQGDCVFIIDRKDANYLRVGYVKKANCRYSIEPEEYELVFADDNSIWIYKSNLYDKCKVLMFKE